MFSQLLLKTLIPMTAHCKHQIIINLVNTYIFNCINYRMDQKQRIVDILLLIMVENSGFTPTQIGALFLFLARQLSNRNNTIHVNNMLFDQVRHF